MAGATVLAFLLLATRRRTLLGFFAAIAMAAAVYMILDIEYPRLRLIRVDVFDQARVELRESMK